MGHIRYIQNYMYSVYKIKINSQKPADKYLDLNCKTPTHREESYLS